MAILPFILWAASVLPAQEPWVPEVPQGPDPIGSIDVSASPNSIVPLPSNVHPVLRKTFVRYTRVLTPSGKPIHILAQDGWSEDQILHARGVLEHLLTNAPGTRLGADKAPVAEAMAKRRATLVLFNTERHMQRAFRGELGELELGFQDLRANECPAQGDLDYLAHGTRDAAFEEVLHLVHDYGIRPALPEYDEALQRANLAAAKAGHWDAWPEDEPENHRNEYFAAAYDNYLDLWARKPKLYEGEELEQDDIPDGTSHFGMFEANTRAKLLEVDPVVHALIEDFFPPYLTYMVTLPTDFVGTFRMGLDEKFPYTHKSQHLTRVRLAGEADSSILGNSWDNQLSGNVGDNLLAGGAGDDLLNGGGGIDTALYRGLASEYEVTAGEGCVLVTDKRESRDGTDTLRGVEFLQFADKRQAVPE